MRIGTIKSRPAERFAKDKKQSAQYVVEDILLREFIDKEFANAGVAKTIIRKTANDIEVIIFTSKVGAIMGKNGEKLKAFEEKLTKKFKKTMKLTIKEVRAPETSAKIMAEYMASQLENRMPYRKVAKTVMQKVMDKGAIGVKIQVGGRLGGTDIARMEKFIEGRVSLQTFRSDIDYHYLQANTKYGVLGVKVWIAKGTLYNRGEKKPKTSLL